MSLTKRQAEILLLLLKHRDCDDEGCDLGELVYERGRGFIGFESVAARTVFRFLRENAIQADTPMNDIGNGIVERYTISEIGERMLREEGFLQ